MNVRMAFALVAKDYGVQRLASEMGVNPQVLANKANPHSRDHSPTLKDLEDTTVVTRDPRIADAFCQMAGGVFVPVGDYQGVSDQALLDLMTELGRDFGAVCAELQATLSDGNVDPAEIERMDQRIYAMNQAAAAMRSRLKDMMRARPVVRAVK